MKIKGYVAQSSAIISGIEEYGEVQIEVPLADLTEAERIQLESETRYGKAFSVTGPTAEAVKARCAELVAKDTANKEYDAENRRRRAAEHEALVARLLNTPIDKLIAGNGMHREMIFDLRQVQADPRLADVVTQAEALVKELNDRYEAEWERKNAEEKRKEAEAKARKEAEQAAWNADKAAWIEAHGSDRLKKALDAGYNHNGAYAEERAALELGDKWVVDIKDSYGWKDKVYPSEEALDMEKALKDKGHSAFIVWVTDDGKDREYDDEPFEPFEAVLVKSFVGKYDVIHPM